MKNFVNNSISLVKIQSICKPIAEFLLTGKLTKEEQWRATLVTAKYILPSIFNYYTSKPVFPAPLQKNEDSSSFFFLTALDFPFHHSPQSSQAESSTQSREVGCTSQRRTAEIQWKETRFAPAEYVALSALLTPASLKMKDRTWIGDSFQYSWATGSLPTLYSRFLCGLCCQSSATHSRARAAGAWLGCVQQRAARGANSAGSDLLSDLCCPTASG